MALIISFLFFFFIVSSFGDKIVHLPGLKSPINFNQYAGYINVDHVNGRNLFYWFVESQNNPATDKLVLWLNGGPGCSSIGGGLMTELGPFRPNPDSTLSINPNSWNKFANIIFLESPAGVGFSYSNTPSDYTVGDVRTANDTYTFLLGFFKLYPQYQGRPFWITGESYGGHYVPEAAKRIVDGNAQGGFQINLEGIMVGNAWTWARIDNFGAVYYWFTHALISNETYRGIVANCDFSNIGPLDSKKPNNLCDNYLNTASSEMGNINIYDIYVDVCLTNRTKKLLTQMGRSGSRFHQILADGIKIEPPYQPCIDEFVFKYMNEKSVKQAIHANMNLNYQWEDCSSLVNYNYQDLLSSVLEIYFDFFKNTKLRVLVYSGDVDAIVPITGTREWIAILNRKVISPWRPYIVDQQVGGYVVEYEGLTFASVRNAGHLVPETQPSRALYMFSKFLEGKPL